tara:strand:+ start:623 stop:1327 length:705 start_codon:yes stop_codon:yes gene_type:complete
MKKKTKLWEREEMILVLDFYINNRTKIPGRNSEEFKNLQTNIHKIQKIFGHTDEYLRTLASVSLRIDNYRSVDPSYKKKGMQGGGIKCKPVWDEFSNNWDQLHKLSEQIKNFSLEDLSINDDLVFDDIAIAKEGKLVTYKHLKRERNAKIVREKKKIFKRMNGRLFCEACKFDFKDKYGKRGEDFIECHHINPISLGEKKTSLSDLVLLCSNCHRMIHKKQPWLEIYELIEIIK